MKNNWELVADYINERPATGFSSAEPYIFGGLSFKARNDLDRAVNLDLNLSLFPYARIYINDELSGVLDENGRGSMRGLLPGNNTVIIQPSVR